MTPRFLAACRRQPVDRTPVWLMRQAGRYMPEYRALRERYGILELIRSPELAVVVTLQPMAAFDLDAAIIFSDILPLLEGMGLSLAFVHGEGPVIGNPIRRPSDVAALADPPVEEGLGATLEAIRLARRALPAGVPLIGFSGAPFTLASYAVEGGASRDHARTKGLLFEHPAAWHALMDRLSGRVARYLVAQAEAGADALQIFDSWAGAALSPADYRAYVLPYTRRVVGAAVATGVPVIHFGVQTAGLLEDIAGLGCQVIGLDWHVDLDVAWRRVGGNLAVQGNLDPAALLGPWEAVRARADDVLARAAGRDGHVFNLGHGVLPGTPVDTVKRLVDHVHAASAR